MAIALMGILFFTAGVCGIVALIFYHAKRLHMYRETAKFTGPPVLPVIGNGHYFFGSTHDLLNKMIRLTRIYPSPFRLWMGNRLYFVISDAETAQAIVNSPHAAEKEYAYQFIRPFLGTGLLTAPAAKARLHRKFIQPTFNQRILDSFVEIFVKQSNILKSSLSNQLNKGEFNIYDYTSRCTFDMICEATMGLSLNAQTDEKNRFFRAVERGAELANLRIFKIWLQTDFLFNLTKLGKEFKKLLEYLHGVADMIIEKKMSAHENGTLVANETAGPKRTTTRKSLLDLLIELTNDGVKLTKKDLRDEMNTMLVAGSETTAMTNSFALMMLAIHPEIQEKAYQELCEIYGDEVSLDTAVKKEDLNRMVYLERIIKETLRLFPPGPFIARTTTGDIKIGDRTIPEGSGINLALISLHRCEKYWPDPLKFDPDRFLPEQVAKRHPYCYLPFSAGARSCPGSVYAMMSMKTLLATVLRRYVVKKDNYFNVDDIKLKADILMKTVEPMTVRVVERTSNRVSNANN